MHEDAKEHIVFASLRRAAKPGMTIAISVGVRGAAPEERTGVLVELDAAGLVLETEDGTEFVPANEILKWRLRKEGKTLALPRIETETPTSKYETEPKENAVAPVQPPDTAAPMVPTATPQVPVVASLTPKTEPSSPGLPPMADLEVHFAGEPQLAHPEPSFDLPILERTMRQDVNRWRDKYNYAMKVREPARMTQLVAEVAELAETLNDGAAYCLAGSFAFMSGLGIPRARQYYEAAAMRGSRTACLALAHIAITQKEWRKAAESLVQALLIPTNAGDDATWVRLLGQCLLRTDDRLIPGFGNYLLTVTGGDEKTLATSLALIVLRDDADAMGAITTNDFDKLRTTTRGAKLFATKTAAPVVVASAAPPTQISGVSVETSRKGRISAFLIERGFGFLVEDTTGNTWHFYATAVQDPELLETLNRGQTRQYVAFGGTPVHNSERYPTASGVRGIALWLLAVKLLALPVVAAVVGYWLGLEGLNYQVVVLFAALPTASSAYILAMRMGGDGRSVAWLISATTLGSMLTLPLWAAWLTHQAGG